MIQKNTLSLVCFMTYCPILTTTAATAELVCSDGVVEKHDFRDIQQKILQISDFAKNRIRTYHMGM
jgi:hypothetical protein